MSTLPEMQSALNRIFLLTADLESQVRLSNRVHHFLHSHEEPEEFCEHGIPLGGDCRFCISAAVNEDIRDRLHEERVREEKEHDERLREEREVDKCSQ